MKRERTAEEIGSLALVARGRASRVADAALLALIEERLVARPVGQDGVVRLTARGLRLLGRYTGAGHRLERRREARRGRPLP